MSLQIIYSTESEPVNTFGLPDKRQSTNTPIGHLIAHLHETTGLAGDLRPRIMWIIADRNELKAIVDQTTGLPNLAKNTPLYEFLVSYPNPFAEFIAYNVML